MDKTMKKEPYILDFIKKKKKRTAHEWQMFKIKMYVHLISYLI